MRRVAAIIAGVLLGGLGMPAAYAHADLIAVQFTPADPGHAANITLTFSEEIGTLGATVVVLDANGESVQTDSVTSHGATISVDLVPISSTGTYRVNFRAVAADGHVVTGSRTIGVSSGGRVKPSGIYPGQTAAPETSAVTADDPRIAYWFTAFLMLCALLGGVGMWRLRQGSGAQ